MALTTGVGVAQATYVPIDSGGGELGEGQSQRSQAELINELVNRILKLESKLKDHNDTEGSTNGNLKPIDIHYIERPDKYDNRPTKFNMSYMKFKDLLMSRNENWGNLLDMLEARGKVTIRNHNEFIGDLEEEKYKPIKEQAIIYAPASQELFAHVDGWRAPRAHRANWPR